MHRYAMKAAGISELQIADRIAKFERLKMAPMTELHLLGLDDIYANAGSIAANCRRHKECQYVVHFPVMDIRKKYIFDARNDEEPKIEAAMGLCEKIGSKALILHRCFGFGKKLKKDAAEAMFLEKVVLWNKLAKDSGISIFIENLGFGWLPEGFGDKYALSPIDHFYPWDIMEFNGQIKELKLRHIHIALDLAHAALSSNMFNMLKKYPKFGSDERFCNIYAGDLKMRQILRPEDFVFDFIGYYHMQDSHIWRESDGVADMRKFLYTENLPLGKGDIDLEAVLKRIPGEGVMVMEINPENGDYNNNVSQLEGIERIMRFYNKGAKICA